MSSYVYPLDLLNNNPPRAFMFSSANAASDTLIIDSQTSESRLRFINSATDQTLSPNFVLSASNHLFSIQKNAITLVDYDLNHNSNAAIINIYGTLSTCNYPNNRGIVLQEFDQTSSNQFVGMGYSNSALNFQLPNLNQNPVFAFNANSNRLVTIQSDINGNGMLGIGISNLTSGISLQVANNAVIGGNLSFSSLTSPTNYIDINNTHLCNIGELDFYQLGVASIVSTCNNNISFNHTNIIDVDTLIVRSNITVLNQGLFSYCNLPINTVFINSNTGTISDTIISSNVARLQNDGMLNPALFPPGYSSRSTLLRTQDKVGIGLRYPQQKLHVNGNQCITGGRLGIGTTNPVATFDIYDNAASPYSFQIVNVSSTDMLRIYSSNQMVFNVSGECNVGIRNPAPLYPLDVSGDIHTTGNISANGIKSDNGLINCSYTSFSNAFRLNAYSLDTGNILSSSTNTINFNNANLYNIASMNVTSINVQSPATSIQFNNAIRVSGYDTFLYNPSAIVLGGDTQNVTKIGIKVDECIMARSVLTTSDKRTKNNIKPIDTKESLNKLMKITVKNFNYIDHPDQNVSGLIAQEIEKIYPESINTITDAIPNIKMRLLVIDKLYVNNDDYLLEENKYYKFCHKGTEYMRKLIKISTNNYAKFNEPLLTDDDGFAFLYGEYVDDFKVINYERMIPLIIGSLQELHKKFTQ